MLKKIPLRIRFTLVASLFLLVSCVTLTLLSNVSAAYMIEAVIVNEVGLGDPFFCKYICPAGILEGGIPLSLANGSIRASLGNLFTWKSCILLGMVALSVLFYRPFCKWICPLGAFYALFNKISLYRFHIDGDKCTTCGACSKVCKMDVDVFRTPNHTECIRCGDCIRTCPHQAITKTFSLKSDRKKAISK